MPSHILLFVLALFSFRSDETIRNYGMGMDHWQVVELNGEPFDARATLHFTGRYKLAGHAPCNSFRTTMSTPFPWFDVNAIAATKRACPDLRLEAAYFDALKAATLAQVTEGRLILSDEDKPLVVFTPAD